MISSGFEPATFRLVEQRLKQLLYYIVSIGFVEGMPSLKIASLSYAKACIKLLTTFQL
jgi:hypothetical protein